MMSFELKGAKGGEKVHIFDKNDDKLLDGVKLTQDWKMFSYLQVRAIRIYFSVQGDKEDVFFKNSERFVIEHTTRWQKWSCGIVNENKFCSIVRDGKLYWGGNYSVSFRGGTCHLLVGLKNTKVLAKFQFFTLCSFM